RRPRIPPPQRPEPPATPPDPPPPRPPPRRLRAPNPQRARWDGAFVGHRRGLSRLRPWTKDREIAEPEVPPDPHTMDATHDLRDTRRMSGTLVVTGASRGIGAATARLAAARGWAVAVNYRSDGAAADALVSAIRAEGGSAVAIQADVAAEADVLRLFAAAEAELGPLRGLVNNAGVLETQMPFAAMEAARWTRIFATNVFGAFLCAREAVRRM